MTDDELLDVLRQALDTAEREAADATVRAGRYAAAIAALQADGGMPKIELAPAPKAKSSNRRDHRAVARKAAAKKVECPECGQMMSAMGIGTHRRIKHDYSTNGVSKAPSKPSTGGVAHLKALVDERPDNAWTPERAARLIEAGT